MSTSNPSREPQVPNPNPFSWLATSLEELAGVLTLISDEQYSRPRNGAVSGSLGGHVRHCLDHFVALCRARADGIVDYERRERGSTVETSRAAALQSIVELRTRMREFDPSMIALPVRVVSVVAADGTSIESLSTLGRELAFVLSHTVHHNALVAAICRSLDVRVPERFGFAPSTLAFLDRTACAPSPS